MLPSHRFDGLREEIAHTARRADPRAMLRLPLLLVASIVVVWCATIGLASLAFAIFYAVGISGTPRGIAVLLFAGAGIWQGTVIVRGMWGQS